MTGWSGNAPFRCSPCDLTSLSKYSLRYLAESNLKDVIINTPSIADQFGIIIQQIRNEIIYLSINVSICLVGLISLVIYLAKLYGITNRKKIAVMRMNGFRFSNIYRNYLAIQLFIDIILLLLGLMLKIDIFVFAGVIVSEILLFFITAKQFEHNQIIEVMKEGA